MLAWIMNLDFAGGGVAAAPVAPPTADRGRDAGSGRKVIDPWEVYGREREEPVTRLPGRLDEARERLRAVVKTLPDAELIAVARQIAALRRAAQTFERRVEAAAEDRAIEALATEYRGLEERMGALGSALGVLELQAAHRLRLLREDEEFVAILKLLE